MVSRGVDPAGVVAELVASVADGRLGDPRTPGEAARRLMEATASAGCITSGVTTPGAAAVDVSLEVAGATAVARLGLGAGRASLVSGSAADTWGSVAGGFAANAAASPCGCFSLNTLGLAAALFWRG